jgi:hypothetical protein
MHGEEMVCILSDGFFDRINAKLGDTVILTVGNLLIKVKPQVEENRR